MRSMDGSVCVVVFFFLSFLERGRAQARDELCFCEIKSKKKEMVCVHGPFV